MSGKTLPMHQTSARPTDLSKTSRQAEELIEAYEAAELTALLARQEMQSGIRRLLVEATETHGSLSELAARLDVSVNVLSVRRTARTATSAEWGRKLIAELAALEKERSVTNRG